MTINDIFVLLPLIVIAATALVVMLAIAFHRSHMLSAILTFTGITGSFASLIKSYILLPRRVTLLFVFDHYAIFFSGLILIASLFVTVLSYGYLKMQERNREEFYILLLLSILGSMVLISGSHFASFFLGIETLSVSLYALIAYPCACERSIEAGIKYLILASVSAAFLLFGMALIYAELGTMEFARIASRISLAGVHNIFFLTGTAMIITGVGFKLALAPFHMWTSDVYEGAPAPVTAFIATVSKGAVFALLLRYFTLMDIHLYNSLFVIFALMAAASMFIGNLLALTQNNVKRVLAYSSISHMGYLLVAFLASKTYAVTAVTFYLTAYFITTLGAFGIVSVLYDGNREADDINDYIGLAWRRPLLGGIFTLMLLSLAGIPLTAGFIGKFYIMAAGVGSSLWLLVMTLVINSAIGLFYYLRIIVALYKKSDEKNAAAVSGISWSSGIALGALSILLVWLGVYPAFFIDMIRIIIGDFT